MEIALLGGALAPVPIPGRGNGAPAGGERREDLQRQQRDLQALLRELEDAESNCQAALDALEPPRTKRRL